VPLDLDCRPERGLEIVVLLEVRAVRDPVGAARAHVGGVAPGLLGLIEQQCTAGEPGEAHQVRAVLAVLRAMDLEDGLGAQQVARRELAADPAHR
jgi:hypothetical protein